MKPLPPHTLKRLAYFLKDDKHALLYCLDLLWIAHLWDDLLDRDKEVTGEDINQAFIKSLSGIPNNPFYKQCQPALLPMMYNTLVQWLESNELKKGSENDRVTAFTIMHSIVEIIHFCILIKGGVEWAREVATEFWQLFGVTMAELTTCLEASDV